MRSLLHFEHGLLYDLCKLSFSCTKHDNKAVHHSSKTSNHSECAVILWMRTIRKNTLKCEIKRF